jgi:NMT1-like family
MNRCVRRRISFTLFFTFVCDQYCAMSLFKLKTLVALSVILLAAGCNKTEMTSPAQGGSPMKIRVGYIGITCEAPIFCAVENGFFKEEGLDVELVKCEWSKYKDVLALGGFDITHHLIMYLLKPIEQGVGREVHCWDPSRLSPDTVGHQWQHQNGTGSPRKTNWRTGNGNSTVYLCQSSSNC